MCGKACSHSRFYDLQMNIFCQRKIWILRVLRVKCVFMKSTEGWIWLLKTLKEHKRDGLKGGKKIYILGLKSVKTDAWFDSILQVPESSPLSSWCIIFYSSLTFSSVSLAPISMDIIKFINTFFSPYNYQHSTSLLILSLNICDENKSYLWNRKDFYSTTLTEGLSSCFKKLH